MTLRAYCSAGQHHPRELLTWPEGCELSIRLNNAGDAVCWGDGTVGIPDDVREEAELDDSPLCAEHYCEVTWEHEQ